MNKLSTCLAKLGNFCRNICCCNSCCSNEDPDSGMRDIFDINYTEQSDDNIDHLNHIFGKIYQEKYQEEPTDGNNSQNHTNHVRSYSDYSVNNNKMSCSQLSGEPIQEQCVPDIMIIPPSTDMDQITSYENPMYDENPYEVEVNTSPKWNYLIEHSDENSDRSLVLYESDDHM